MSSTWRRAAVNRCAVKACPFLGHWLEGGKCPGHAADDRQPADPSAMPIRLGQDTPIRLDADDAPTAGGTA